LFSTGPHGSGYRDALSYQIVVSWVIAEHKSQGLFQSEYEQHELEEFWRFAVSGNSTLRRTIASADLG
jgi:hypothetical protein